MFQPDSLNLSAVEPVAVGSVESARWVLVSNSTGYERAGDSWNCHQ